MMYTRILVTVMVLMSCGILVKSTEAADGGSPDYKARLNRDLVILKKSFTSAHTKFSQSIEYMTTQPQETYKQTTEAINNYVHTLADQVGNIAREATQKDHLTDKCYTSRLASFRAMSSQKTEELKKCLKQSKEDQQLLDEMRQAIENLQANMLKASDAMKSCTAETCSAEKYEKWINIGKAVIKNLHRVTLDVSTTVVSMSLSAQRCMGQLLTNLVVDGENLTTDLRLCYSGELIDTFSIA